MLKSIEVAPDGSPVAVYLALPAGETPGIIHEATVPGGSILELGSGPGRITRPLIAMGHTVVAVDESPAMLSHIEGAETVLGDVFSLDIGRRFDAVVAGSHFINAPERRQRLDLLSVCSRHLKPDGVALVERYETSWAAAPTPMHRQIGRVSVAFEPLEVGPGWFRGRVTDELDGQTWIQEFTAANVTGEILRSEAAAAGLALAGWLNQTRTWAKLAAI